MCSSDLVVSTVDAATDDDGVDCVVPVTNIVHVNDAVGSAVLDTTDSDLVTVVSNSVDVDSFTADSVLLL